MVGSKEHRQNTIFSQKFSKLREEFWYNFLWLLKIATSDYTQIFQRVSMSL